MPCIGALSMVEIGRGDEAVAGLKELEPRTKTRLREFMIATRALIEGNRSESVAAMNRLLSTDFSDPEGLFYLTRLLAYVNEVDRAVETFKRVVAGGYFCYPAMVNDEWLAPLRKKQEFKKLLDTVRTRHEQAAQAFKDKQGNVLLARQ